MPRSPRRGVRVEGAELACEVLHGTIDLEELRRRYILHIYAVAGSYTEAGRRLGIDWRTVRTVVAKEAARARAAA